ncbi:hypothetical protein BH11PSE11_BH11PSE11_03210 [soil metagenome]
MFKFCVGALLFCFHAMSLAADADKANSSQTQSLLHDGIERSYVVRTPAKPALANSLLPLVIVLHGGGGNAAYAESMTGFTAKGDKENFIVVYPEGTGPYKGMLLTWNSGHCCAFAMRGKVDDVGFISALIDKMIRDYPVDPKRVYATGMSNGGMMAHRLGIELSGKIAAIAPVVATVFGDEVKPQQAVAALMINGMLDKSMPVLGGPTAGRNPDAWDGTPLKPSTAQAEYWAGANGCKNTPEKQDRGAYLQWRYPCPAGGSVEIYLIKDDGHSWPGGKAGSRFGDTPGSALRGTDVIWDFFKAHSR